MDEAVRKRTMWEAMGNPPCDHPVTDKEYYLGSDTGDLVCTTCGHCWPGNEAPAEIWRKAGYDWSE